MDDVIHKVANTHFEPLFIKLIKLNADETLSVCLNQAHSVDWEAAAVVMLTDKQRKIFNSEMRDADIAYNETINDVFLSQRQESEVQNIYDLAKAKAFAISFIENQ